MAYSSTTPYEFESTTGANINFNSTSSTNGILNFVCTTAGDILFRATGLSNTLTRLGIGGANTALISSGGVPTWGTVTSTGAVTFQSLSAIKNNVAQGGIGATLTTITGWDVTSAGAFTNIGTAFNITTGVFTVPATGTYSFDATIFMTQTANNGTSRNIALVRNGTIVAYNQSPPPTSNAVGYTYKLSKLLVCNTGDTIVVQANRTAGGATLTVPAYTTTASTFLNITRLS
jgi:hypothetical protein